jgi:AraC family transcriptional regulator
MMQQAIAHNDSILKAIAPGLSQNLITSESLPWQGFSVGMCLVLPGERPAGLIGSHVVVMARKLPSRFEVQTGSGGLIPHVGRPGEITLMPAGPLPFLRLHTPTEFAHCILSQELMNAILDGIDPRPTLPERFHPRVKDIATQRIVGLLLQELEAGAPSGRLYAESLAHALGVRFLQTEAIQNHRFISRASELPPWIFRRVKEKMEAGLHADLSLADIASESGYSRTHFLRMFRASTGMTPHQYLMILRVDRAKDLLANRNANLIDIATICGFSSQSHLTTVFRRQVGLTPANYRRDIHPAKRYPHV